MSGSNGQKWDWGLLGKAISLIQTILGRFRKITGEKEIDWSLIEWLAMDAPEGMYKSIWKRS